MFLGLYEMIYVCYLCFFTWESSGVYPRERHFYSTLSYTFFKIHCFNLLLRITDHCFHISSVDYVKRNVSAIRKKEKLDSSGSVY